MKWTNKTAAVYGFRVPIGTTITSDPFILYA